MKMSCAQNCGLKLKTVNVKSKWKHSYFQTEQHIPLIFLFMIIKLITLEHWHQYFLLQCQNHNSIKMHWTDLGVDREKEGLDVRQVSHLVEDSFQYRRQNDDRVCAPPVGWALHPLEIVAMQLVGRLPTLPRVHCVLGYLEQQWSPFDLFRMLRTKRGLSYFWRL